MSCEFLGILQRKRGLCDATKMICNLTILLVLTNLYRLASMEYHEFASMDLVAHRRSPDLYQHRVDTQVLGIATTRDIYRKSREPLCGSY